MSGGRTTKVKDGGTYEQYDSINPPNPQVSEEEELVSPPPTSPLAHGVTSGASVQALGDGGRTGNGGGGGGDGGRRKSKSIFGKKDKKKEPEEKKLGKKELKEMARKREMEEKEAEIKKQLETEMNRKMEETKTVMEAEIKKQLETEMNRKTEETKTVMEAEMERRLKEEVEVQTRSELSQMQKRNDAVLKLKSKEILAKNKALESKDKDLQHVKEELVHKNEAILAKDEDLLAKDEDLKNKDEEIKSKDIEVKRRDEEIEKKDEALQVKDEELERKEEELGGKVKELEKKVEELKKKEEDLIAKDKELKDKDVDLVAKDDNLKNKDNSLIAKDRDLIAKDKELISKDKELIANNKELTTKQQTIDALTAEIAEMKIAQEELVTVREHCQKENEKVKMLGEEKQKLEELLEQEKKNRDGEFVEIEKKRDELLNQRREQEAETLRMQGELTQKLKEEEAKNAEQVQKLEELMQEGTKKLQEEAENSALQLKQLRDDLEHKRQELEGAEEHCRQINSSKQQVEEERDGIRKELEELKATIVVDEVQGDTPEEDVCSLRSHSGAGEKISLLQNANKTLEHQLSSKESADNIPSNVYHFSHQLSKLVDNEGDSFETSPRPLSREAANRALQAIGVTPGFKPQGFVVAVFHALNNAQCILLDYTRVGEVKGHEESSEFGGISTTCSSHDQESGVSSGTGNMTDSDKKKLLESQQELEKLKKENENLLFEQEKNAASKEELENYLKELETEKSDHTSRLETLEAELNRNAASKAELEEYVKTLKITIKRESPLSHPQEETALRKETAESAETDIQKGKSKPVVVEELNKRLRANYLKVNEEKILLIAQLEDRDVQIKKYRDELAAMDMPPASFCPNVQRSLSAGEVGSPEDPKAEVHRLRKVLKEKEVQVDNLTVQLQSFNEVACGNMDLGRDIVKLKEQLKASEAKIKILKDDSELAQVSESLSSEIITVRKQLQKTEVDKQDIEVEMEIWKSEMSAEKENQSKLQGEIDRLKAALKFLQSRHPSEGGDIEFNRNDSSVDMSESSEFNESSKFNESAKFSSFLSESQDSELKESLHQVELTGLNEKIIRKDSIIKGLTFTKNVVERRLRAMTEERDRLAQQNVELFAMKANYKGQLNRFDEIKHSVEETRVQAKHMHVQITLKTAEIESLRREREALEKEKEILIDELEARKFEAIVIKEDFDKERQDREAIASSRADDVGEWTVLVQEYVEKIQHLQGELKRLTHESEQEIFQLKTKLNGQEAEAKRIRDHQVSWQKEMDEIHDGLREEKGMSQAELNRMTELYQDLREENRSTVDILKAEKNSLEDDKLKKEKLHELTASEKLDLKEKLEKKENNIKVMDIRLQDIHSKWIETKNQLEGAIADTSRLMDESLTKTQQVKQFKKQADTYRDQLQQERIKSQSLMKEERVKIQLQIQEGRANMQCQIQEERAKMQHQLAMFQEEIRRKEEEHRAEINLLQATHEATHESAQTEIDTIMIPLRREVEQLRSQRMNETQMSEVFRKMEFEKKDLENQLIELDHKYGELVDSYTEARDTLLKHKLPLPLPRQAKRLMTPSSNTESHEVRPYQTTQQPFTHLDGTNYGTNYGTADDNISRGGHFEPNRQLAAPMQGERGAPGTQYRPSLNPNRSPPVSQYSRTQPQPHPQPRMMMGGEGSRYNQQHGQKSRDPNLHQAPRPPPQPHRVPVETPHLASRDNYAPPVSGHGNYPPPILGKQGTHNPSGPSGHPTNRSENPLLRNISGDISQAAAYVQSEGAEISMLSIEDARPLDSNLICPMCKVQFRIGQIQPYKRHVDECRGTNN